MKNPIVVIMAKEPKVGATKTRLCPPLNHQQSTELYEGMLLDTIALCGGLEGIDLGIAVTPAESVAYFERVSPSGTLLLPVEGADIGECLAVVIGRLLEMGYPGVLALNADGPTLPSKYISQAVSRLKNHDVVLGPSEDGGYYLVGLKHMHTGIFEGIEWSTPRVLTQTLQQTIELDLSVSLLPEWFDIDSAADLERIQAEVDLLLPHLLVHTRRVFERWQEENRKL
jgi:rSAM/selenodomain-associated transferase 1